MADHVETRAPASPEADPRTGPDTSPETTAVLRSIWQVDEGDATDAAEVCGNTTVCRNMKDVTFADMVGQGTDLRTAWRAQLQRDGKLDTSDGTLGDLVNGIAARR